MPKIDKKLNDSGFYTAGQLIAKYPDLFEETGWTIGEINALVKMGVLKGRIFSKSVYVQRSDFLQLFDYINARARMHQSN